MKILSKRQLRALVLYSPQHITRLEKTGVFHKLINLGPNRVGWVEAEVLGGREDRLVSCFGEEVTAAMCTKCDLSKVQDLKAMLSLIRLLVAWLLLLPVEATAEGVGISINNQWLSIDPHDTDLSKIDFLGVYEPMMFRDRNLQPRAGLIDGTSVESPVQILLSVRSGVFFQDGCNLSAQDIQFSLSRAALSDNTEISKLLGGLAESEIIDDRTLRVTLSEPDAYLESKLTRIAVVRAFSPLLDQESPLSRLFGQGSGGFSWVDMGGGVWEAKSSNAFLPIEEIETAVRAIQLQKTRLGIDEVKLIDGDRLRISAIDPSAWNPEHIADDLRSFGCGQNADLVGSGPYIVQTFNVGDRVTVERSPNWWASGQDGFMPEGGNPAEILNFFTGISDPKAIEYLFNTGEIDIALPPPALPLGLLWQAGPDGILGDPPDAISSIVVLVRSRSAEPPLSQETWDQIKQLFLSDDYKLFLSGTDLRPNKFILPDGLLPDQPEFDLNALGPAINWPNGNGLPTTIHFGCLEYAMERCRQTAGYLEANGVLINLEQLEFSTYTPFTSPQLSIAVIPFELDDTALMVKRLAHTDGWTFAGINDPQIDGAINYAMSQDSRAARHSEVVKLIPLLEGMDIFIPVGRSSSTQIGLDHEHVSALRRDGSLMASHIADTE